MAATYLSFLKMYSFPLLLLALAIFIQLFVVPTSFPPSHYDVLGVKRFASIEEVTEAYKEHSSKWKAGREVPKTSDFIKIRYAFELLRNPLWKRDYDRFGIDEHLNVIGDMKKHERESFSKIALPLVASSSDPTDYAFNILTTEDFLSAIRTSKAWLIQVYSSGSSNCAQFSKSWQRIGLPSLIALPPDCKNLDCLIRYQGDLSVDAVVDWFATTILSLPRILYYSKESLGKNFIMKSGQHKVKVICFSKTGERAAPFLRQAAKNYWAYASFAFVLWREEESSIWWNMLEVESAPAVVFLKDPGTFNNSWFLNLIEQNKYQDLPQLRTVTSMELGCDARGHSRAGNDTTTWYCMVLAGRPSLELNKMRETIRRVQDILSNVNEENTSDKNSFSAANALKEKRLTFAWLDGEAQKKYCFFYLFSEDSYETCGPRRYEDPTDVPRLFIVRYKKNSTKADVKVEKITKTIWDSSQEDVNLASQLVARYNGSEDITQIVEWISQIINDGDSRDLPFFTTKAPELIPEDADPIWAKASQGILSSSEGVKHIIWRIATNIYDRMRDPWMGPMLLFVACLYSVFIWLQRSQPTQPNKKIRAATRKRKATVAKHEQPSSITDTEPKDAYQMFPTDSDSE
ncbi:DnaJ domain-containing protein [Cinnamomum micranthum f. kanehirae]|uniref:DnaJ domain-containing protein n=1 Tax=Cinnamomum micranthum f. kanehirae TaxID=337451 RepID=A0A3S3NKG3_9MAGN|nr:DnaJ domain-containing protein [Cinnamomum micranthum f. kanehirae]